MVKIVTPCFIFIAFFVRVPMASACGEGVLGAGHGSDGQGGGCTSTCEATFGLGCEAIFGPGCGRGYMSHDSYICLPVQLGVTFISVTNLIIYIETLAIAIYLQAVYIQLASHGHQNFYIH